MALERLRRSWMLSIVLVVAVSCGGDDTDSPTTTVPAAPTTTLTASTTTSTLGVNVRYESVFDMRERLEAGSFTCTDWLIRESNDYALESAECTSEVVLAVYPNASAIADQRALRHALLAIIQDTAMEVSGPNWNVGCDRPVQCDQIQSLLGGEVLQFDLTGA